jgi:hypothetical protein
MKKILISLSAIVILLTCSTVLSSFITRPGGVKNKFLEGKKFDMTFYEVKATGRGKALKSFMQIKGGKIQDDLMEEKLALPPMNYSVTLDSTYTEDETEMHMVTFEAAYSEDKTDYKWDATVINYEIEGTVVQSKGGVEKKRYEFTGSEKAKK